MGLGNWLRNAFFIPKAEDFVPTEEQRVLVEQVCAAVVRRGVAMPVLVLLESVRPLHSLSGPTVQFLAPTLGLAVDEGLLQRLTEFLQQPGSVPYVCERLEQAEGAGPASRDDSQDKGERGA